MADFEIPTLETERLRLRPFRDSDFDDYAALCADPEVMRGLGRPAPYTREVAWRHMAFLVGHWQLQGTGMWVAEERASGTFLGRIGFANPCGWPGFELSWALARRFWGRGYATEGARAALEWGFANFREDRVISLILPENRASIRVAERLGESLRDRLEWDGREYLVYGVDRTSYGGRSSLRALKARRWRSRNAGPTGPAACPTGRES